MHFEELVMRRRTVRRFEDAPVDRSVLEKIARLAQRTPSAGFSQGQRVVIVTEREQRRRVAETCGEAGYAVFMNRDERPTRTPGMRMACSMLQKLCTRTFGHRMLP